MVEELLKRKNIKITKPRIQIINSLKDSKSLKDIINENENVNKSTIYRIMDIFLKKEIIEKEIIDNKIIYKIKSEEHIHYLNCIKCKKKIIVKSCPLNKIEDFKIVSHKLDIQGYCINCC